MKADEICEALRAHYRSDSQALVFEVPDGVGNKRKTGRHADAMLINFWESRGLEIEGFEIKVSRSDWQRELQTPAKGDAHFVRCDRWWLVTPRRAGSQPPVAKAEEIPGPWGWMAIDASGEVVIYKKAPKLVPSVQFDKAFAFALVRAAAKHDRDRISREVEKRVASREVDFTKRVNAAAAQLATKGGTQVDEPLMLKLREAFGRSLDWLGDDKVVEAIQAVRALADRRHENFEATAENLRQAAEKVERAGNALDAIKGRIS